MSVLVEIIIIGILILVFAALFYFFVWAKICKTLNMCEKSDIGGPCVWNPDCKSGLVCCNDSDGVKSDGQNKVCVKPKCYNAGSAYCTNAKYKDGGPNFTDSGVPCEAGLGDACSVNTDCRGWDAASPIGCCAGSGKDKLSTSKGVCMALKKPANSIAYSCPLSNENLMCPIDKVSCVKPGDPCAALILQCMDSGGDKYICCDAKTGGVPIEGELTSCTKAKIVKIAGVDTSFCPADPLAGAADVVGNINNRDLGDSCTTAIECKGDKNLACCNKDDTTPLPGSGGTCRVGAKFPADVGPIYCLKDPIYLAGKDTPVANIGKKQSGDSCTSFIECDGTKGLACCDSNDKPSTNGTCRTGNKNQNGTIFCKNDTSVLAPKKIGENCVAGMCAEGLECCNGVLKCFTKGKCDKKDAPCLVGITYCDGTQGLACCDSKGANTVGYGTCTVGVKNMAGTPYCPKDTGAPKLEGDKCTVGTDCAQGLTCCSFKCAKKCGVIGAPCLTTVDCSAGSCVKGKCSYLSKYSKCTFDGECGPGYVCCPGVGRCFSSGNCGKKNAPCANDVDCKNSYYCAEVDGPNQCRDRKGKGGSCGRNRQCDFGECCKNTASDGECRRGWGGKCSKNTDCCSRVCGGDGKCSLF